MSGSVPRVPGEKPARARRKSGRELLAACEADDHRAVLRAMRDDLARSMASAPATVVAQIAARLQAVEREYAALPNAEKVSLADDLAARRSARRAGTDARASAVGDGGQ